jgi:uncharacterized membrane protein
MAILMMIHVLAGTIAVLSGASALVAQKGQTLHRAAGNLFFFSMSVSAIAGSIVAIQTPTMITFIAGLLTFYLVLTSWLTVKTHSQNSLMFSILNLLFAGLIAYLGITSGLTALEKPNSLLDGYSAGPYFFFGGLAIFCLILDGIMIWRRGHSGAHRIARHLWRMCLALYIAMGSLFTGPGAQVFPESLQGSWILSLPENIVALLMLFWLARYLVFRTFKSTKEQPRKP